MVSESTVAVVSLFNAGDEVIENVSTLLAQVRKVVVVDDGSTQDPNPILRKLESIGCKVERLTVNSGIAAALNTGIMSALSDTSPPAFILTMDQDSRLDSGYVQALEQAAGEAETAGVRVGLVAPGNIRGLQSRRAGVLNGISLGGEPIQSGLLVPVSVIHQLGTFQTQLFIDGVDTEYFLRTQSAGYKTILAPKAALNHSLGSMTNARLFGRPVALGGHTVKVRTAASWRYYYLFRNRLLLAKAYGRKHLWWAVKGFLADYRHLAIVTLLAPGRWQRIAAVTAGIADGLVGRSGKRRP